MEPKTELHWNLQVGTGSPLAWLCVISAQPSGSKYLAPHGGHHNFKGWLWTKWMLRCSRSDGTEVGVSKNQGPGIDLNN